MTAVIVLSSVVSFVAALVAWMLGIVSGTIAFAIYFGIPLVVTVAFAIGSNWPRARDQDCAAEHS